MLLDFGFINIVSEGFKFFKLIGDLKFGVLFDFKFEEVKKDSKNDNNFKFGFFFGLSNLFFLVLF